MGWMLCGCLILSGGLILSGCSMYQAGFENLIVAPSQFHLHKDRRATERYHRELAAEALAELQQTHPRRDYTVDYRAGYEAGVVDYLTNGGTTAPPLLPPRYYWTLGARTTTEHSAAQQWLSGATDGRAHAESSGLRSLAVVPASPVISNASPPLPTRSPSPEALPPPRDGPVFTEQVSDSAGRVKLDRTRGSP